MFKSRRNVCLFLQITSDCMGTEYCKLSTFAKRSLSFQGIYLFSFNSYCMVFFIYQAFRKYIVCRGFYLKSRLEMLRTQSGHLGWDATLNKHGNKYLFIYIREVPIQNSDYQTVMFDLLRCCDQKNICQVWDRTNQLLIKNNKINLGGVNKLKQANSEIQQRNTTVSKPLT